MTITTVDEGIIAHLSNYPGLTSLISDRVYLMRIPQSATLPCLCVTRIDTPRELTHDLVGAENALAHPRFQFDAWAKTYASAKAITDQLRAALNGHRNSLGYHLETATVVGTIVDSGHATVVVTCTGMTSSPITESVAVLAGDTAVVVAGKVRAALNAIANLTSFLIVTGMGPNVALLRLSPGTTPIADFNISISNGDCSGLVDAPFSTETFNSIGISAALVSNEMPSFDQETKLYRSQSDYIVWYEE